MLGEGAAQQDEDGAVVDEAVEQDDRGLAAAVGRRWLGGTPRGAGRPGPGSGAARTMARTDYRSEMVREAEDRGAPGRWPWGRGADARRGSPARGPWPAQSSGVRRAEAGAVRHADKGQNLHGRPPVGTREDGSVPRVPSWEAADEVHGGVHVRAPRARVATGLPSSCVAVRRTTVPPRLAARWCDDLVAAPLATGPRCGPCAAWCGTVRGEHVPSCDFPLAVHRETAGCGMLEITFVHFPGPIGCGDPCPMAAQSVCGGSDGCDRSDPRGGGQAGARRPRSRGQGDRAGAARRGHGGHLHRPPPDPRADRGHGDPGGRRRDRALHPLRRPQHALRGA